MAITDKIGVLVIHGMGAQQEGYSKNFEKEVTGFLGGSAARFVWQEIYWAKALEPRESDLWQRMEAAKNPQGSKIPLDWKSLRNFVIHNFGDALAYHRDTLKDNAYDNIHTIVSARVKNLKDALPDPGNPIVVVAHSLGSHIMSNYIWDHQASNERAAGLEPIPTLAAMITFGCNIPLFALSFAQATPIDVPGQDVKKPALVAASRWLNFVDRDDVLGWPLKPLYEMSDANLTEAQKRTVQGIEDFEINVGGLVTSWNPAAHSAYWEDNDFTKPVAAYLQTLFKALDI
jgi:hypothetical protein